MPPKSRKSLGNSWYSCEACGVFISHKDVQLHQSVCPVDIMTYNHSFIKNAALFSFVEKYSVTGNEHIQHNSMFSNYLCGFLITGNILDSINKNIAQQEAHIC